MRPAIKGTLAEEPPVALLSDVASLENAAQKGLLRGGIKHGTRALETYE